MSDAVNTTPELPSIEAREAAALKKLGQRLPLPCSCANWWLRAAKVVGAASLK